MSILPILTTDNPSEEIVLRTKSSPVTSELLHSDNFHLFIDNMFSTLKHGTENKKYIGVGLSAVQVGELLNLFISYDSNRETFFEYINPRVTLCGQATEARPEVCLSIPGKLGNVERYKRVKVEWMDREGQEHKKEYTGFNARIIQHEYDHLQGILFVDKVLGEIRKI